MIIQDSFYNEIKKLKGVSIYKNASIKKDNNMRVDGIFLYKIEVSSYVNVRRVFELIKKYDYQYYIIGMGSNVLFVRDYYEAVIVKLMPITYKETNIISSGSAFNYINSQLIDKGIETLNFLSGVPCSVGGAIYMNAGAFNKEMKDIIEYVYYLDLDDLKIKVRNNIECQFEYRNSYFKHHNCLILGVKIKLIFKDKEQLLIENHKYLNIRKEKLPLEYPNLGSVFKNPKGFYIGKMIEDMGIKELSYKGAMISNKHANVIINYNNASGKSILKLVEIIEDLVYIKYKTKLEREIIIFK